MTDKKSKLCIIGAGISGLSAACYAAKLGMEVVVYEKNDAIGGRARQFKTDNGYTFDMGPSWYWMPDVIEGFFKDFGYTTTDFYQLIHLDPQFEVVFPDGHVSFPHDFEETKDLFESFEKGAAKKLEDFMRDARVKYEIGMKDFVSRPCHSWLEFASLKIASNAVKLDLLTNFRDFVARYFQHPYLRQMMEFPVIFLGASPKNIPAMYSMMNYGGYKLGTYYPIGGFYKLIEAMETIAKNLGVEIVTSAAVEEFEISKNEIQSIKVNGKIVLCDYVIGSADYHHVDQLLEKEYQNYSEEYWAKKTFAPSCLIFYLGLNTKIPNLKHHTLFFENDLDQHVDEIYETKQWPQNPLFYTCCPSKTDDSVAPEGHENLFLLMPIAIGIEDNEALREKYFDFMIEGLERKTGMQNLKSFIDFKKSYCIKDFKQDYNAYGGNAYGLANTLKQTAVWKPKIKNRKIANLYYAGQLTVPGPGVPPSLISGKIAAHQLV